MNVTTGVASASFRKRDIGYDFAAPAKASEYPITPYLPARPDPSRSTRQVNGKVHLTYRTKFLSSLENDSAWQNFSTTETSFA